MPLSSLAKGPVLRTNDGDITVETLVTGFVVLVIIAMLFPRACQKLSE